MPSTCAARLQQAAEPGTIVVGSARREPPRTHFELRRSRAARAEGEVRVGPAWFVGRRPRRGAARRPRPGRAACRSRPRARFPADDLRPRRREHRPELVTLLGDAGIGKSRLVREFLAPLEVDVRVLVGRCSPYGQSVTLWPLAEILKAEAVVLETDRSDAPSRRSHSSSRRVSTRARRRSPRSLTGSRLDTRPTAAGRSVRRRSIPATSTASSSRPGLRCSPRWASAGPSSPSSRTSIGPTATMLDVLDELAERLDGPILFLCTSRPDLFARVPTGAAGVGLQLAAARSAHQRGERAARLVPPRRRRPLRRRTPPDPRALRGQSVLPRGDCPAPDRRGLLVREGDPWMAREGIDDVEIPDNVHAVILARLDLLSAEEKRSFSGRRSWDGLLGRCRSDAGRRSTISTPPCTTLRRREFVLERVSSSIAGQTEFMFKHVLSTTWPREPPAPGPRPSARGDGRLDRADKRRAKRRARGASRASLRRSILVPPRRGPRRRPAPSCSPRPENAQRRFAIQQGNASGNGPSSFPRRERSGSSPSRPWATSSISRASATPPGARTARRARSSPIMIPHSRGSRGRPPSLGARWTRHDARASRDRGGPRLIDSGIARQRSPARSARGSWSPEASFSPARARFDDDCGGGCSGGRAAAEQLGDPDLLSAALDLVQAGTPTVAATATVPHELEAQRAHPSDDRREGDRRLARRGGVVGTAPRPLPRGRGTCERVRRAFSRGRPRLISPRARVARHGPLMLGDWDAALADQAEVERVAGQDPRELPAGYTVRATRAPRSATSSAARRGLRTDTSS